MAWILIVDDEPPVARAMRRSLVQEGLEAIIANDLDAARSVLQVRQVSLVLLDLRLGNQKSFDFAREVAEASGTPIMFVTGSDDVVDKVIAFEIGAHDYITKPFDSAELVARVRGLVRRTRLAAAAGEVRKGDCFRIGDYAFDFERSIVKPELKLTRFELQLLRLLAHNQGSAVTREQISLAINRRSHHPSDRTIDVMVSKLRSKLGPHFVRTVRGEGYALGVDAEALEKLEEAAPPAAEVRTLPRATLLPGAAF